MLKRFQQATWKVVNLVNSPRKAQKITRSAVASRVIFDQYLDAVKIMDARHFCAGSLSELSMRVGGGKFMINPAGIPFSLVDKESLIFPGIEKISQDMAADLPRHADWHQMIYMHTNAAAVLLCQPQNLMVVAVKNTKPSPGILKDADDLIGQLIIVPQEKFVEENIKEETGMRLVPSVGILLWGQTLAQLIDRVEILERVCAISILND